MAINERQTTLNTHNVDMDDKVRTKVEKFIGTTLGHLRRSGGVSRNELSKKTGLSVSALRRYENGTLIPSVSAVYKIAEILNFDAVEFITLSKLITQSPNEPSNQKCEL